MRLRTVLLLAAVAGLTRMASNTASKKSTALEKRVNSQFTSVWNQVNQLTPLAPLADNSTFLAGLSEMNEVEGDLPFDGGAGNYWNTGERDYYNNLANSYNNLVDQLRARGFMS